MHELDAGKRHRRRPEGFETEHWSRQSFDGSMILFDDVVEVFDLTDLNGRSEFSVVAHNRSRVGAALVDRDLLIPSASMLDSWGLP
jgi:hypothetical protein